LLFFISGLKDAGAKRVTAIVPYLAYARKDHKSQARDPVATRYIAQLFEAVGTDTVVTMDVHNVIAYQNAFRCHTIHLEAGGLLSRYIATRLINGPVVVVSPDIGGIKRAEKFRQRLSGMVDFPVSMAVIEKYRSKGKLSGSLVIGEVSGCQVILIDDLISSGQTLVRAAIACQNQGALSITAMATHGLFVHDAVNLLGNSAIDQIVTSDSVIKSGTMLEMPFTKFEQLSCADLLAQTITRLHNDGSIVDLIAR
jgi:ribose-phosphate pyrophosphokinase